jgi:hypothetical protein
MRWIWRLLRLGGLFAATHFAKIVWQNAESCYRDSKIGLEEATTRLVESRRAANDSQQLYCYWLARLSKEKRVKGEGEKP